MKHFVLIVIIFFLSGAFRGARDSMQFHTSKFYEHTKLNTDFWGPPHKTWKNKYAKDSKLPKFPLSTTLLVFTTDGWHLLNALERAAVFIGFYLIMLNWRLEKHASTLEVVIYKRFALAVIVVIWFAISVGFNLVYFILNL